MVISMIGAIDIGGTKTITGLADQNGQILEQIKFESCTENWETHFERCAESLSKLCNRHQTETSGLKGIGISLPAMTDSEKGILVYAPFSGWRDIPVAEWFARRLNQPAVYVENDVNACALGELKFGHGRTYKDFLWITVSTGIGGAVVADARLITGWHHLAGEFGHLKVERVHPRRCPCGQEGCLEAHASGTAIGKAFQEYLLSNPEAEQILKAHPYPVDAYGCRMLAVKGDKGAMEIYRQAGRYLGIAIAQAVNLLNPQAVIFGGGVSASLDLLEPEIRRVLEKEAVHQAGRAVFLYTALGYEAALAGAAALVP